MVPGSPENVKNSSMMAQKNRVGRKGGQGMIRIKTNVALDSIPPTASMLLQTQRREIKDRADDVVESKSGR
jgi:hypothetical protein